MKIRFTETTRKYRGHGYRFDEPGEYEVEESTAKRLLKDFPSWFESVTADKSAAESKDEEVAEEASVEASKGDDDEKPSINLSKANRAQLEAFAAEIGLEITEDLDTNKKLKDAIEAYQDSK